MKNLKEYIKLVEDTASGIVPSESILKANQITWAPDSNNGKRFGGKDLEKLGDGRWCADGYCIFHKDYRAILDKIWFDKNSSPTTPAKAKTSAFEPGIDAKNTGSWDSKQIDYKGTVQAQAIQHANNIANVNSIVVGKTLDIPGVGTYKIAPGDTLDAIAAGRYHTVALKNDGTVVAWGDNGEGQTTVPNGLTDVVYVAAGANSSAAVTRNGRVVVWGENRFTMTAPNCCASAIAMNYAYRSSQGNQINAQTITVHKTGMQTKSAVISATTFPFRYDVRFSGLIPGRRYRYTLTLTNNQGSQVYTGVFVNDLVFHKSFTPLLLNSSPVLPPVSKGK
jgi:hypothetical protein